MTRYTIRFAVKTYNGGKLEETLNHLAADGWHLAQVLDGPEPGLWMIVAKRDDAPRYPGDAR